MVDCRKRASLTSDIGKWLKTWEKCVKRKQTVSVW